MDYQEEKVELSEENVLEINRLLQEAADKDAEDVVEDPYSPLEPPTEPEEYCKDWEEYKGQFPDYGPPEDLEEEV